MFRDRRTNQAGFTLLDIVIGVTFLSVVFLTTMRITNDLQQKLDRRSIQVRATAIANSMLSIIRSVNFDENWPTSNHTQASNLGMDPSAIYDDVDDFMFNPTNAANFGSTDDGYLINVSVYYVDPLTAPPNTTIPLTGTSYSNFKRIIVSVDHTELLYPVELSAIVTPNVH